MADYKELLRRAVEALPENNGAARRAVYEKARAALVGQLRAINPPLAARDITAHRLQLEDCIRQVEQEASEAVIAGLGANREEAPPSPPVYFEPQVKKTIPAVAKPVAKPLPSNGREPPKPLPQGGSIEEIIAAANAEQSAPVEAKRTLVRPDGRPMGKPVPKLVPQPHPQLTGPVIEGEPEVDPEHAIVARPAARPSAPPGRPLPSIVARAEAAKSRTGNAAFGTPIGGAIRGPVLEPRREIAGPRLEPAARSNQQLATHQAVEPIALFDNSPVPAAMSAVREVEVEPTPVDPQGAIDRAIATLDREARGEGEEPHLNGVPHTLADVEAPDDEAPQHRNGFASAFPKLDAESAPQRVKAAKVPAPVREPKAAKGRGELPAAAFPRARAEPERGVGAVTIFLIVFAVLLLGAGGAGFWAWREGYINLDQLFAHGSVPVEQQANVNASPAPAEATPEAPATGPGNTSTPAEPAAPAPELKQDERLPSDAPAVAETQPLAIVPSPPATEDRLGAEGAASADKAAADVASVDPANVAGSQSLLLEASDNGTTGAVPFSGTVEWTKGTDEMGVPTLVGKANIPARNLGVDVLIRKNSDPSLPASHLMEVNFRVNDSFIGGSIAGLPGVLLKNEELVQGTPLVGASARVVGNSFLFALSASPQDVAANSGLLTSRKWMDLALIYATGKRAIITLEKDEAATRLFSEVVADWSKANTASQ